jgi:hypothetical protein
VSDMVAERLVDKHDQAGPERNGDRGPAYSRRCAMNQDGHAERRVGARDDIGGCAARFAVRSICRPHGRLPIRAIEFLTHAAAGRRRRAPEGSPDGF